MTKLSLIIPTYNESQNIPILLERIHKNLAAIDKEVIVVDDDSPDKTWEIARSLRNQYPWLHVIRRVNEKGLSSAVLKGFELAEGDLLAVMDADLQHDEEALPQFLEAFKEGADIVVGSRKVAGGGVEDWSLKRKFVSWVATVPASFAFKHSVTDPMSGFFAIRSEIYHQYKNDINPRGFKILLEFLARARSCTVKEVGYTFKGRIYGESKLSSKVIYQYLQSLYDLSMGRYIPSRFVKYGIVGFLGLLVATFVIWICAQFTSFSDGKVIAISIEVNILANFFMNNYWTFRAEKLKGPFKILRGMITFNAICLGGALINQSIAVKLLSFGLDLYLANAVGYFIAAIWNYIINVNVTWKNR